MKPWMWLVAAGGIGYLFLRRGGAVPVVQEGIVAPPVVEPSLVSEEQALLLEDQSAPPIVIDEEEEIYSGPAFYEPGFDVSIFQ